MPMLLFMVGTSHFPYTDAIPTGAQRGIYWAVVAVVTLLLELNALGVFGKTPGGTRGIASLSVLLMVMLGGAWVPSFIFPAWLQKVTVVVPARWPVATKATTGPP